MLGDQNRFQSLAGSGFLELYSGLQSPGEIFFFGFWFVCLFFQYPVKGVKVGARSVIVGKLCWRLFQILNYRKLDILSHASLKIHFTANISKFLYDMSVFVNSLKSNECFIKEI